MEVWLHAFLAFALDGGEWTVPRPSNFSHGAHWIGGWARLKMSQGCGKDGRQPLTQDVSINALPVTRVVVPGLTPAPENILPFGGRAVTHLVDASRTKTGGPGLDLRWGPWIFSSGKR